MGILISNDESPKSLGIKIKTFYESHCVRDEKNDEYFCNVCNSNILQKTVIIKTSTDGIYGLISLHARMQVPYCYCSKWES